MVRIVVAVKHVPPEGKVHVSRRTGKLVYDIEQGVMNPLGKKALSTALQLAQEEPGSDVIAISIGPPAAISTMREALAMGADRAVLLSDPQVAESDSLGIAKALTAAIQRIGDVDIIMTGARTTDRYAGNVGPSIAALLGWDTATHGRKVALQGGSVRFEKVLSDGRVAVLRVGLPCHLSIGDAAPKARHATSWGVHAAFTTGQVEQWALDELGLAQDQVGPAAAVSSVTKVERVPDKERETELFEGEAEDVAESLVRRMASRGLLR